jgi:NADPH2:quinone reductase
MHLPATFKHISVNPDSKSLYLDESTLTAPVGRDVLIKVTAAGINRADLLQRQGMYPAPLDASPILGLEVAGVVAATGPDVTQWQVGDRVCALVHGGGYANYCAVREDQCLHVPDNIELDAAAGLPEALLTAWHNVFERAQLKPGETLLVQGGSSGIGSMAVQMAKLWGAKVIATAGGAHKCQRLKEMGVDLVIDYREQDFEVIVKDYTEGGGVDVIFDMVGGDYIQKHINCAAVEGRIVNIAYQNGFVAEIHFGLVLIKRLSLLASTLRPQSFDAKARMTRVISEHFGAALSQGNLLPVIDSIYPLAEAEKAQNAMAQGNHFGKILLRSD